MFLALQSNTMAHYLETGNPCYGHHILFFNRIMSILYGALGEISEAIKDNVKDSRRTMCIKPAILYHLDEFAGSNPRRTKINQKGTFCLSVTGFFVWFLRTIWVHFVLTKACVFAFFYNN